MASRVRPIRIQASHRRCRRWKVPLSEEIFSRFAAQDGEEAFREGWLFSPRLFGKFFDPADAFPLWDFDRETLLPARGKVDWGEAEDAYLLRADLPGGGNAAREVEIWVDDGKVMEIGRQVREPTDSEDWRTEAWWEYGHVRRLELPNNVDWRKAEASVEDDAFLRIKLPKIVGSGHALPQEA